MSAFTIQHAGMDQGRERERLLGNSTVQPATGLDIPHKSVDQKIEIALRGLDEQLASIRRLVNQRNLHSDVSVDLPKSNLSLLPVSGLDPVLYHRPAAKPRRVPQWVTHYLVLWSVIWQAVLILFLHFVEDSRKRSHTSGADVGMWVMLCGQALHMCLVIVLSVKMVKQARHLSLSMSFLIQSYLSVILLFAGTYLCVYRLSPYSFESLFERGESSTSIDTPITMWVKTLYFSISTMSTVGYGDLHPRLWYTRLLCAMQMLISVVYTVGIFSMGISHFNRAWRERDRLERHTRRQRSGSWQSEMGDHTASNLSHVVV